MAATSVDVISKACIALFVTGGRKNLKCILRVQDLEEFIKNPFGNPDPPLLVLNGIIGSESLMRNDWPVKLFVKIQEPQIPQKSERARRGLRSSSKLRCFAHLVISFLSIDAAHAVYESSGHENSVLHTSRLRNSPKKFRQRRTL